MSGAGLQVGQTSSHATLMGLKMLYKIKYCTILYKLYNIKGSEDAEANKDHFLKARKHLESHITSVVDTQGGFVIACANILAF